MPNHVRNKVTINGTPDKVLEVFKHMRSEEDRGFFDFNKIVQRPPDLDITSDGLVSYIENDKWNANVTMSTLVDQLKKSSDESIENFCQGIRNLKKHGYATWYNWSVKHWGTKWNGYSQEVDGNSFIFDTAWSGIPDLIQKLSGMFPGVEIDYKYADEDTGCNTGHYVFKEGHAIKDIRHESGSNEAYELAFELRPDYKNNYKLINGKYEYIDED